MEQREQSNKTKLATTRHLLVSAGNVVKDRIACLGRSSLVEDVQVFEGLEFVLLMHVVLGHDLLKLSARHVHAAPPAQQMSQLSHTPQAVTL